jgi:hypothetical protein
VNNGNENGLGVLTVLLSTTDRPMAFVASRTRL